MMNIFIMILFAVFMTGFYLLSGPNQRVLDQEPEYAISRSDLKSVAQCAIAAHNAKLKEKAFDDICVEQNGIVSNSICLDNRGAKTECQIVRNRKPAGYVITATDVLADSDYNSMMEILETSYSDVGTFGIFSDGKIISGDAGNTRTVPKEIITEFSLTNGQLVYLTQYEIPDEQTEFSGASDVEILCPAGTIATYRFGRWQCIPYNTKTDCPGDKIWDSDAQDCVPDDSRKPLCASQQTAVMIDDVWECINPFPTRSCSDNMVARLNYTTLEWECVSDPTETEVKTKCDNVRIGGVVGGAGSTLRVSSSTCTDCERMITDTETCTAICVPDPAKINDVRCYSGSVSQCSGDSRAFYFGFPSYSYASNVSEIAGATIPINDGHHSQNRRFNCLDCGEGVIDTALSVPPYIAICK